MSIYYLDSEYKVHLDPNEGELQWEDTEGIFDNRCRAYIETYRVVPVGHTWTREDGEVFEGLMIAPHRPLECALMAQALYTQLEEKLENNGTLLKAQIQAVSARGDFVEDVIAEMAMQVYP